MKKKLFAFAAALALLPWSMAACTGQTGGLTVLDADGNTVVRIEENTQLEEDARWGYLQIVLTETAQLLAEKQGCTAQQALEQLFDTDYTVYTAFDSAAFAAITAATDAMDKALDMGCAITDLGGNLIAAYSTGKATNYAANQTPPYSAFKPLSVYLPAVETGRVNWFTGYEDSAYKQIENEDGTLQAWPSNSTNTYSGETVPVYQAIADSLNTVAVKCLADVGVETSMTFLQERFGMNLAEEAYVLEHYGPEEVIGNVALGYLETGVSPVDMAGYYQIFANGGVYTEPRAVTKLCDAGGAVLYEREYEYRRVATAGAADIMNRLLQGVVSDGTGIQARCQGVEVAGKTGTGDSNEGNWFVGVIPGYSCAVWHGSADSNRADELFSAVMQGVFDSRQTQQSEFYAHEILYEVICCTESGMAVSENCTSITLGYFLTGESKEPCRIHK